MFCTVVKKLTVKQLGWVEFKSESRPWGQPQPLDTPLVQSVFFCTVASSVSRSLPTKIYFWYTLWRHFLLTKSAAGGLWSQTRALPLSAIYSAPPLGCRLPPVCLILRGRRQSRGRYGGGGNFPLEETCSPMNLSKVFGFAHEEKRFSITLWGRKWFFAFFWP